MTTTEDLLAEVNRLNKELDKERTVVKELRIKLANFCMAALLEPLGVDDGSCVMDYIDPLLRIRLREALAESMNRFST